MNSVCICGIRKKISCWYNQILSEGVFLCTSTGFNIMDLVRNVKTWQGVSGRCSESRDLRQYQQGSTMRSVKTNTEVTQLWGLNSLTWAWLQTQIKAPQDPLFSHLSVCVCVCYSECWRDEMTLKGLLTLPLLAGGTMGGSLHCPLCLSLSLSPVEKSVCIT